ncbi:MAG: hypothetical protein LIO95_09650 [Clostridiales bacterium]|nr:hypothetical protein [Clostridiales bacterium]
MIEEGRPAAITGKANGKKHRSIRKETDRVVYFFHFFALPLATCWKRGYNELCRLIFRVAVYSVY